MRHFETLSEARKYLNSPACHSGAHVFRKKKGHKNRIKKPFAVCSWIEFINFA